jgi:hypothetical protein
MAEKNQAILKIADIAFRPPAFLRPVVFFVKNLEMNG